jgi:hypothetical protein
MAKEDEKTIKQTLSEAERLLSELDKVGTNRPKSDLPSQNWSREESSKASREFKITEGPGLWIAVASLISGVAISALVFSAMRQSPINSAVPMEPDTTEASQQRSNTEPTSKSANAEESQSEPKPTVDKQQQPDFKPQAPPPRGAWGSSSEYKFGQIPGGDYPDSCAFSRTDAAGRTTTDKSAVEYWACRDNGGNGSDGFTVSWSDGKTTRYMFGPDGDGSVVGTNGTTYPMTWRNDTHDGTKIIVISHQDGATTWIPGNVN